MTTQRAQAMDRHVGRRIRERRISLCLTQKQLGSSIGVSYQQVNKIERGINRITAGRLYHAGKELGVTVGWFFQDFDPSAIASPEPASRMRTVFVQSAAAMDARYLEALAHMTSVLAEPGGGEP